MIRNASGQYSSVNDDDEWRFGFKDSRSSILKFKPQFIIVPGRMVRIQALGPKDCGAEARIDLAMPVPWEFLTSEMWYCTNCYRNSLFQKVLKEIKDIPILSNMIIMERLCPAIGVNPVPRVKDISATILPTNAKRLLRPMKWVYDRPLNTVVRQAHTYRADVPVKAGPATIVNTYTIPTLEIEYYTLQFGDAVDAKSTETGGAPDKVTRDDATIVVDKLYIIPPFDSNVGALEGWMKNVADLPKDVKPAFKDKILIGEFHQATAVDLIHAGGDGGELEAAEAEKEEEAVDDNNTTIDQYHVLCEPSVLMDDQGHILNEYRAMVHCPFCEQEALMGAPVEWKTRKLHAFTTHVRSEHDFVVYPSRRGYTYQQLVGGRQAHAAQQWVVSEMVHQERTDRSGHVHRWRERKIKRSPHTDEKNGDLQPVIYTPIELRADHCYSPKAVPTSQPNKHLMIRDDYPEVLGAEMSAINGKKYFIPRTGPEAVASWSTRLARDSPSTIYQMDPLSSPNDLSPVHMATTPVMWMTPADMKIFLRPQDEGLEDTWKKAMTILCYVVTILRDCCEFTDFRQTSFGSTYMTLLGFAQVMHVTMPMQHVTDEASADYKKSKEGLYFTVGSQQDLAQKWEAMRHQCVIQKGPEIQGISYHMERILGITFDGSIMTKDSCGLAVVDDQLTLVTDVILEKGIEAVTEIAGLIQLKETYVREWVAAYDVYRQNFNKDKSMKTALSDPYRGAWDSWPEKVWKSDNDSVVLVQADIRQEKNQRTQGVMQCVWNNVRAMVGAAPSLEPAAVAVKEEESEGTSEPIRRPDFFTGELPLNTIVDISAFNRPDQTAFIRAANAPPSGYEDEPGAKRVMPQKAPFAFEWPENSGWNAQTRLDQRISLEQNKNLKIWTTLPGQAAKTVESELAKLSANKWTKKGAEEIYTRISERNQGKLSEREMITFRWMCFHLYLGGTPTSNPCTTDVFGYFHGAMSTQCEFMYDKMKGPGMTGLYASCGFTKYVKELDAYMDEYLPCVTDMDPLLSEAYQWCANRRAAFSLRLVWVVAQLMNAYQQHHIDFRTVFALTDREWEIWCQQWHMYKRDYAIGITHSINPKSDQRYELVCLYLEVLTRMEIQETPPGKKDAQAWVTFNPAKCTFCSQLYKKYESVTNAASAAWNHVVNCSEANLQIKGDGPTFPEGSMVGLDLMSIIEAKMTKCGGLDFETNIEWLLTSLVETAIGSRVDFFKSLLVDHALSAKKATEQQLGVNIPFLRLIANGQIFNMGFVHPKNDLRLANEESKQCLELLNRWIQVYQDTTTWGGLTVVTENEALPARSFSFSPNERMGKLRNYSHPRLHPMSNQRRPGDVWILVPTSGSLPMGSFCGTYGYGIIHPNLINASVIQMSYASSHPGVAAHGRSCSARVPQEPDPERAPDNVRASFDMMSVAPNFRLIVGSLYSRRNGQRPLSDLTLGCLLPRTGVLSRLQDRLVTRRDLRKLCRRRSIICLCQKGLVSGQRLPLGITLILQI